MTTIDPIPESVLTALEEVRASGETNMLAREAVIQLAMDYDAPPDAVMWLYDNKARYVEALKAMGERRRASAER
jgi:hypothetical protein